MKYSEYKELNAVMNFIEAQLLCKGKDKQESLQIIKLNVEKFPDKPDYNLVNHGGMLCSPLEVKEMNIKCGYSPIFQNLIPYELLWNEYLLRVGKVAKALLKREETIDMDDDFKFSDSKLQANLLKRMGYKEESPKCKNCKHYSYNICDDPECLLIPLINIKIHDDAYCNYYKTNNNN